MNHESPKRRKNEMILRHIQQIILMDNGKCSYVCDSLFDKSDKENIPYSFEEFDIYAWIPKNPDMRNHRLTLYKNMTTDDFEVYRQFMQEYKGDATIGDHRAEITTQIDTDLKETTKVGTLQECLNFINGEREKFHEGTLRFCMCNHKYPSRAIHCKIIT